MYIVKIYTYIGHIRMYVYKEIRMFCCFETVFIFLKKNGLYGAQDQN
jgi:hypothetical protein